MARKIQNRKAPARNRAYQSQDLLLAGIVVCMLGLLFGLNIPACAAPLILALLGLAAAGGATAADNGGGFVSLAIFGLALSLPLVVAVLFAPARPLLDRMAALSHSMPRWTGAIFALLGLWSIWFALYVPMVDAV